MNAPTRIEGVTVIKQLKSMLNEFWIWLSRY